MKSTFSKYRYHNGKRWIGGTAAYNHFFKENGGIDKVLTSIAEEAKGDGGRSSGGGYFLSGLILPSTNP